MAFRWVGSHKSVWYLDGSSCITIKYLKCSLASWKECAIKRVVSYGFGEGKTRLREVHEEVFDTCFDH